MESDQTTQGGQTQATSAPSGGSGVQQPSVDINGVVNSLVSNPQFQEALARQVQSVKDRRFAEQERQISGFQQQLAQLEQLQAQGFSRPAALQLMEMQERLEQYERGAGKQSSQSAGPAVAPVTARPSDADGVDADAFLKAVGVDPSDPEVTALYRSGNVTAQALVSLVTKKKSSPPASPATVMPSGSGTTVKEDLMDQYRREIAGKTQLQIIEIRDKYRRQGLPI